MLNNNINAASVSNPMEVMTNLNSCDELIEFMKGHYNVLYKGNVNFQGDIVRVGVMDANPTTSSIVVVDAKHPGYVFLLTPRAGGWLQVAVFRGSSNMDQLLTVFLPDYVQEELIATITGEW